MKSLVVGGIFAFIVILIPGITNVMLGGGKIIGFPDYRSDGLLIAYYIATIICNLVGVLILYKVNFNEHHHDM